MEISKKFDKKSDKFIRTIKIKSRLNNRWQSGGNNNAGKKQSIHENDRRIYDILDL